MYKTVHARSVLLASFPRVTCGRRCSVAKCVRFSTSGARWWPAVQLSWFESSLCRYMAAKKYEEALELLQSGACVQLKHGQVSFSISSFVSSVMLYCSVGISL